jgi:hypothetical protein
MFIKMAQFPDPIREVQILFFYIPGILLQLPLMGFSIQACLTKNDLARAAMVIRGQDLRHNLQQDGSHGFLSSMSNTIKNNTWISRISN